MSADRTEGPTVVTERDAVRRERVAFKSGANWRYLQSLASGENPASLSEGDYDRAARDGYAMPKVERPREVADPDDANPGGTHRRFSIRDGVLQCSCGGRWADVRFSGCNIPPTAKRCAVLADLFAHPTELVEDSE